MSQPMIPPRPQRTQGQGGPTAVAQSIPPIPPRPVRKTDPSPNRDASTRSPFNEPPTAISNGKIYGHSNLSASELPRRPPSVAALPLIGQEGNEYASFDQLPDEAHGVGAKDSTTVQTRHADVPMQQPMASVPQSTAKERISTVTRTDSSQAARAGIGKPQVEDDVHNALTDSSTSLRRVISRDARDDRLGLGRVPSREPHPLRAKESFSRSTTSLHGGTPRPGSVHGEEEHEHGIPEIGLQVPMYRNAGDVQAPSPSPFAQQFPGGIGFFNDGTSRNHNRKRSSRQEFGPPDSYGLHGHPGQEPSDQFEQDWIRKHPELAAKEGYNVYGGLAPRPATALSKEQLDRLVAENLDVGFGTSPAPISTPPQEIGWVASDEFNLRMNSPKPAQAGEPRPKRSSSGALPESLLRKVNTRDLNSNALDSEDDNVIHVNAISKRGTKVTGGGEMDNKLDLGPRGGNTADAGGLYTEEGFGTPILASDEVMKRPGSAQLQPAISPEAERIDHSDDVSRSRRSSLQPLSRPSSRPNSMHAGHGMHGLHRFISHDEHFGSGVGTPLEEIEEYEPLFPEGEEEKKAAGLADKVKKRPGLAQHHFPSQDIWEDTPASLQFTANVETPEPEQQQARAEAEKAVASTTSLFESPEQEQARKDQNPETMESDNKTFAKPHFKAGVADEHAGRPGLNRFPSSDIWEDTPNSMYLETTVSGPQEEEVKSPPEERPTTGGLYHQHADKDARATTGLSQVMKPQIPSRPSRASKLAQDITTDIAPEQEDSRQREVLDLGAPKTTSPTKTRAPIIPDRPKPTIPARPARTSASEQTGAPLAKSISAGSTGDAPKAKPAVPARPAGAKFGNLKSDFINTLANKIQLGPTGPPPKVIEPEPEAIEETEKAPLADARKGRAKGPARRKAAASTSPAPGPRIDAKPVTFTLTPAITLWHIDETSSLLVPSAGAEAARSKPAEREAEKAIAANVAQTSSTASIPSSEAEPETASLKPEASPSSGPSNPVSVGPETPIGEKENPLGTPATKAHTTESIGHPGDEPDADVSEAALGRQQELQGGLREALGQAEDAPGSAEELQAKGDGVKGQVTAVTGGGLQRPIAPEEGSTVIRDGEEVGRAGAD
nr:hypothetical protein B0A51_07247 [Rachicladosporium sp. CCFEE 5018]